MRVKSTLLAVCLLAPIGNVALAQTAHDHASMNHTGDSTSIVPNEPGKDAFAAIAEIVRLLMNDPHTDWRQVNIDALRSHLVDMDNLVSHAEVRMEPRSDGAVFIIALTRPGGEAAGRMVPAHAPVLAEETGWASDAKRIVSQIVWTVTSPTDAQIIRALGFFGLMALGNHHPKHHLNMATGMSNH